MLRHNKKAISVLLHLNSADAGGETSFPVADNRTYEEEVSHFLFLWQQGEVSSVAMATRQQQEEGLEL